VLAVWKWVAALEAPLCSCGADRTIGTRAARLAVGPLCPALARWEAGLRERAGGLAAPADDGRAREARVRKLGLALVALRAL